MVKKLLLSFLMVWASSSVLFAQDPVQKVDPKDMLLTNISIQLECTDAINDLYNFKFTSAERKFNWLRQEYPNHPLPYFLMGLSNWWKTVPNVANTDHDSDFFAYMDTTIQQAEAMYDRNENNPEAAFFLAGAYGFKARRFSELDEYRKATFAAKNSLKYLRTENEKGEMYGPEFQFGTALYNYYRVWIPENKGFLKPVIMFFPKGNKKKGLEQLEKVSMEAFYTRIEAMHHLMDIYGYEKEKKKAYTIIRKLANEYPDNAYFQREFAFHAYSLGKYEESAETSLDIIKKIDQNYAGYEDESGRKASYFLGKYYLSIKRDSTAAKTYFQKSIEFGDKLKAQDKGYYHASLCGLAKIAHAEGDKETAIKHYERVKDLADSKTSTYKEAKKYLREHKEKKWLLW